MDNLASLVAAYQGAGEDGIPTAWTPAHVATRMIEAMDIATKTAGRIGPSTSSGFWPSVFYDFADYVGREDGGSYLKDRRAAIERQADREFSSLQIARADEALNWASRYLADAPVLADALQLWALCKARRRSADKMLRRRAIAADKLRQARAKNGTG